jgi:SAM-dependent methyltransferase
VKRFSTFSLFNSHLDLAHDYWQSILTTLSPNENSIVVDATCGNGRDTLFLAQIGPSEKNRRKQRLIAIDKQPQAIENSKKLLQEQLPAESLSHIEFHTSCHSSFPADIPPASVILIVYNLGYLPGGDKNITTTLNTTLQSLQSALPLLRPGGLISVTCYPGHYEGKKEEKCLLEFAGSLPPSQWSSCHHRWLNRKEAPSLLLLQKDL